LHSLESEVKSVLLPPPVKVTDPAAPPLLTGTFRPKELLRRVKAQNGSFEWEFAPANVPDGISLRNFGIQVVCIIPLFYLRIKYLFLAYICNPFRYRGILSQRCFLSRSNSREALRSGNRNQARGATSIPWVFSIT